MRSPDIEGMAITSSGRKLVVASGVLRLADGKKISVRGAKFEIAACPDLAYSNEPFQLVAADAPDPFPWTRTPRGTLVGGTVMPNLLDPGSVKVRAAGVADPTGRGGSYSGGAEIRCDVDLVWGRILAAPIDRGAGEVCLDDVDNDGSAPNRSAYYFNQSGVSARSSLGQSENVLIDYNVYQRRISTLYVDNCGRLSLLDGQLSRGTPSPPAIPAGSIAVANINAPPKRNWLEKSDIMPIASLYQKLASTHE